MRRVLSALAVSLALHVALGALVPVVVYKLTLELFGSWRSAIAAGLIFAFYPAAIAVSLGARVETPFLLAFGIGLIALVRAWRPDGRVRHAVCAGLAITLASALRYEAWMLIPFLTLLLVRHPKRGDADLRAAASVAGSRRPVSLQQFHHLAVPAPGRPRQRRGPRRVVGQVRPGAPP